MVRCILFILHLPPPIHGAAMVGKYIHDSQLINDTFDCHYINLTIAKDLQDIGKSGFRKLWRFVKLLLEIRRKVKAIKPQLVYVTPNAKGGAFYKDFVVVQMLKTYGCKVVCHYHNKGVKTKQNKWLDNQLYKRFFKGIKVILLANALYDDVQKYVKREDVYICPNGIPATITDDRPRPNNVVPRLLFLSNLLIEKGVLVLLDALEILKDRGYFFICDFVGGETTEIDAARFEAEVRKRRLNTIVTFLGRKYGEKKQAAFNKVDIFVFPTYYHNECFPLVLLEAMQCGVACISTNEGGIPDIVKDGENGLITERRNAECLANCIQKMLDNPDLCKQMGRNGREKFHEHFTIEVFERTLVKILSGRLT